MSRFIDITGEVFDDWTVLYRDTSDARKNSKTYWVCKCECGKIASVYGYYLRSGRSKNCGCKRGVKDEIGNKYNKLTVIERDKMKDKGSGAYWICKCECGNTTSVLGGSLRAGEIKSCGCLTSAEFIKRRANKYVEKENYVVGITSNDIEFYVDKKDYDTIKKYRWVENSENYLVTSYNSQEIKLHRLIMDVLNEKDVTIDHIDRNPLNNRRDNLRVATAQENQMNRSLNKNNTNGVAGVGKSNNKWIASITFKGKSIFLGSFSEFNKAVIARLKAEQIYFDEFAPQKHLYEKYLG